MTRDECKKLLPIMQAFAEGKTIQFRTHPNDRWQDIEDPSWYENVEYRVKPEVVKVEMWAVVNVDTGCMWNTFEEETDAVHCAENAWHGQGNQRVVKLEGTYER